MLLCGDAWVDLVDERWEGGVVRVGGRGEGVSLDLGGGLLLWDEGDGEECGCGVLDFEGGKDSVSDGFVLDGFWVPLCVEFFLVCLELDVLLEVVRSRGLGDGAGDGVWICLSEL